MKTILLPEDMGIKKARKFYNIARMIMDGGADCAVDFSQVRRIDLSVAQVILSLRRECLRKGGSFEIRNTNESTGRLLGVVGLRGGA